MNEPYNKNQFNYKVLAVILAISIGSPLLLHYWLKPKEVSPQPVVLQQIATSPQVVTQQVFQPIVQSVTQQVIQVVTQYMPHVEIQQFRIAEEVKPIWLGSPVTRAWQKTGDNSWETIGNQFTSLHSPPTFKIGLRSDGVVIWKKVE